MEKNLIIIIIICIIIIIICMIIIIICMIIISVYSNDHSLISMTVAFENVFQYSNSYCLVFVEF